MLDVDHWKHVRHMHTNLDLMPPWCFVHFDCLVLQFPPPTEVVLENFLIRLTPFKGMTARSLPSFHFACAHERDLIIATKIPLMLSPFTDLKIHMLGFMAAEGEFNLRLGLH